MKLSIPVLSALFFIDCMILGFNTAPKPKTLEFEDRFMVSWCLYLRDVQSPIKYHKHFVLFKWSGVVVFVTDQMALFASPVLGYKSILVDTDTLQKIINFLLIKQTSRNFKYGELKSPTIELPGRIAR